MQLKCNISFVDLNDEIIGIPADDAHGESTFVLRLNKEGKEILELIKSGITKDEIVEKLASKYENSKEELTTYVNQTVQSLLAFEMIDL